MKFHWYDPYLSVIGTINPAFRTGDGLEVSAAKDSSGARELLYLAAGAAGTLLGDAAERPTRDEWEQLVRGADDCLGDLQENLRENLERFSWRDPLGRPRSAPEADEIDHWTAALFLHQTHISPSSAASDPQRQAMFQLVKELWCVLCLRQIDDALLSVRFEDAGSGVPAAIRAAEALANARALVDQRPPPFRELARRGAEVRHAPTKAARAWVWLEWQKHRGAYGNNKSDFARSYVHLVSGRFVDGNGDPLMVTEKTIREVWVSSPPSAGKPAG